MTIGIPALVLYYEHGTDTLETIESLKSQGSAIGPIYLIDNASPTRPASGIGALPAGVTVIRMPRNLGYAGAINRARRQLIPSADRFLVVTHEVRLHEGCVRSLLDALDADGGLAAAGPLILRRSDSTVYSAGGTLHGLARRAGHVDRPAGAQEWPSSGLRLAEWLDGSTLLIRGRAFDAVGGFDIGFFLYVEDLDLAWRLRAAGHRVAVVLAARSAESSAGRDPVSYLDARLAFEMKSRGWAGASVAAVDACLRFGWRKVRGKPVGSSPFVPTLGWLAELLGGRVAHENRGQPATTLTAERPSLLLISQGLTRHKRMRERLPLDGFLSESASLPPGVVYLCLRDETSPLASESTYRLGLSTWELTNSRCMRSAVREASRAVAELNAWKVVGESPPGLLSSAPIGRGR